MASGCGGLIAVWWIGAGAWRRGSIIGARWIFGGEGVWCRILVVASKRRTEKMSESVLVHATNSGVYNSGPRIMLKRRVHVRLKVLCRGMVQQCNRRILSGYCWGPCEMHIPKSLPFVVTREGKGGALATMGLVLNLDFVGLNKYSYLYAACAISNTKISLQASVVRTRNLSLKQC